MTATTLCLSLVAMTLAVPVALGRGNPLTRHPGRVVVLWTGSVLVGAVALVAAAFTVLVPVPLWQREGCTGCASVVTFAACSLAALVLGGLIALLAASAEREWRRNARVRTGFELLLSHPSTISSQVGGRLVHQVDATSLPAVSLRLAGEGVIVLDRSLVARLDPGALHAVVAHEAAHLDLWHDRVRCLVRVVRGAFPWLPGADHCATRVELLLEAIADDRAAEVAGEQALLRAMRHVGHPASEAVGPARAPTTMRAVPVPTPTASARV